MFIEIDKLILVMKMQNLHGNFVPSTAKATAIRNEVRGLKLLHIKMYHIAIVIKPM